MAWPEISWMLQFLIPPIRASEQGGPYFLKLKSRKKIRQGCHRREYQKGAERCGRRVSSHWSHFFLDFGPQYFLKIVPTLIQSVEPSYSCSKSLAIMGSIYPLELFCLCEIRIMIMQKEFLGSSQNYLIYEYTW